MNKSRKVEGLEPATNKLGIDLEAAYAILLKAFIRIQAENHVSEQKEDKNAVHKEIQTTQHQRIQYGHNRNKAPSG